MSSPANPEPILKETQWTVDLEKQVAEELKAKTYEPTWASVTKETGPVFAIDTPPPYPSGRWHIGAVAHFALIDVIARSQRMLGKRVLFPWGLDRNGINIELTVEKKFNKKMHTYDRAEFLELCRKEMHEYSVLINDVAQRVGMSCDFANAYATDSPEYRAMSQRVFIELWNKGDIVEDLRPNNYCPECRTTIADAEVYYEERDAVLYHVRWDLETPVDGVDHLVIATTRPELMPACQVVLVNPEDERYAKLVGSKVKIPTFGRSVKIQAHTTVEKEFGTGAMMICSYGDFTDVAMFRELSLPAIDAIGPDGLMTEAAGHLKGIYVKKARAAQVDALKAEARIVKEEPKKQKFPICERSKNPIEIISLKEWYVRQAGVVEDLRRIAKNMEFHPEKHVQILMDWIDTVTIDWPISRRRYYHTEIPVWYCQKCETPHVPKPGPYYQPWRQAAPAEISKCRKCGHSEMRGETKVFDTWMDSASSNLYILHYHDDRKWFDAHAPCSLRANGRDIIRTWLHYANLKNWLLLKKPAFEHAWITGLGMDDKGRKMSKSLGNVIEPDEILKDQGADAFRFWAASDCTTGDDFRISKDRIAGSKKFISKLHNVSRFVSSFPKVAKPPKLEAMDQWILAELNDVIRDARHAYESFDFFTASNRVRDFVWNLFAPHYVEMAKRRAYAGDASATWTLHEAVRCVLLLLAPVAPFLPYRIYEQLHGGDIHTMRFPEPVPAIDAGLRVKTPLVMSFNSEVWKRKKEQSLALNQPVSGIEVPAELSDFRPGFVAMHNLQA
jgi:valyl-tRNA synthetase